MSEVSDVLEPPSTVCNMVVLQRKLFEKTVSVPSVMVPKTAIKAFLQMLGKYLLKVSQLSPVRACENDDMRVLLLNPNMVKAWSDLPTIVTEYIVDPARFSFQEVELTYNNWSGSEILKRILPTAQANFNSFSQIGHIVHVKLRRELLPFKRVIGQVLLDKVPNCRNVVNKLQCINEQYRLYALELLAGDNDFLVSVKENGCTFTFDFSKVYWNPRLAKEHDRLTKELKPDDFFFDVFAGVGPFSLPAATKGCKVYANDLNPDCFKWLQHNVADVDNTVYCYNLDGRHFIQTLIKQRILELWSWKYSAVKSYDIYICMNQPATALEYLRSFRGLFRECKCISWDDINLPHVVCYVFGKGMVEKGMQTVKRAAQYWLGIELDKESLESIELVRNVSTNKNMYRIQIRLTRLILTTINILEETLPTKRGASFIDDSEEPSPSNPKNLRL